MACRGRSRAVEGSRQPFAEKVLRARWQRRLRTSRNPVIAVLLLAVGLACVAYLFSPRSQAPQAPSPPSAGNESPASAVAGYTAGLFTDHPAAACRYAAPNERGLCTTVVGTGFAELSGSWTIGHTAISGSQAIVDVEYQAHGVKSGLIMVNTDPDAGLPHAGLPFATAYRQVFATSADGFAMDCVRVGGRWYVHVVQAGS